MKTALITIELGVRPDARIDPANLVEIGHDFKRGGSLCVTAYGTEQGIVSAKVVRNSDTKLSDLKAAITTKLTFLETAIASPHEGTTEAWLKRIGDEHQRNSLQWILQELER